MLIRKGQKTVAEIQTLEDEIRELSVPYDYDTKEYPIEVVLHKFDTGEIVVPDYQRELEWKPDMKSRFIESLFLGVPVPPLFVAVLEDGSLEIIDGLQRIGTINDFVKSKFKISKLTGIEALNGFKFSELLPHRKRKFLLQTLRFLVVTSKADLAVRADIFDRLNSTGKKLVPAQIRKGAFATNDFYKFVIKMANSPEFTALYRGKEGEQEPEELVLRFFAYSESYAKHDVAIFLNRYVESKGHNFMPDEKEKKTNNFRAMLSFVEKYFPNGFTKDANSKATPRVRFEAISVGTHLALQINPSLSPASMSWLNSGKFKNITTSDASNNPGRLKGRIEFVRDCLLGVNPTT